MVEINENANSYRLFTLPLIPSHKGRGDFPLTLKERVWVREIINQTLLS
jgi:hypothetical protein